MEGYSVKPITRDECSHFILDTHYAHRWPSVSYIYGLFHKGSLVGCVTYGSPFSPTLRSGIAGSTMAGHVIELNRLCLAFNRKNEASFLISKSLKMLPTQKIVVSFADCSQGHRGVVYQASNFLYFGLSAKRTDWALKGKEHLHGQTISDEFRGVKNRAKAMREKYGEDFYLKPRARKHRYITLTGGKLWKRKTWAKIKYGRESFPKPITEEDCF